MEIFLRWTWPGRSCCRFPEYYGIIVLLSSYTTEDAPWQKVAFIWHALCIEALLKEKTYHDERRFYCTFNFWWWGPIRWKSNWWVIPGYCRMLSGLWTPHGREPRRLTGVCFETLDDASDAPSFGHFEVLSNPLPETWDGYNASSCSCLIHQCVGIWITDRLGNSLFVGDQYGYLYCF